LYRFRRCRDPAAESPAGPGPVVHPHVADHHALRSPRKPRKAVEAGCSAEAATDATGRRLTAVDGSLRGPSRSDQVHAVACWNGSFMRRQVRSRHAVGRKGTSRNHSLMAAW
jgi:hypothetical protein